jgi:hypothetical protein
MRALLRLLRLGSIKVLLIEACLSSLRSAPILHVSSYYYICVYYICVLILHALGAPDTLLLLLLPHFLERTHIYAYIPIQPAIYVSSAAT